MDKLIDFKDAKELYLKKKNKFLEYRIKIEQKEEYLNKGFQIKKILKNEVIMLKEKKHNVAFEDSIWCLMYEMGFDKFNNDILNIPYATEGSTALTKQIDVFAMDDETIVLIECKSAEIYKPGNFKENIESYVGIRPGLLQTLRKEYPSKKVAIIYATRNYEIGDQDKKRLSQFKISLFDEKKVEYFSELSNHLGKSSKYQLLGVLFPDTKIEGLDNKVVAIKGSMGKKTYYSFSIEPEKLLKLSFILHRSNSLNTEDMMPTYQRVIKKNRLKDIREYINQRGFFPNSIIISIQSNGNGLRFDSFSKNENISSVKPGILHLPQTYRSCYVIDGQHRLYGYSETPYSASDVIPVIAFEDLAKDEQVKMFMDINQNQKSVAKTLRNTLDIDLLWESSDKKSRTRALMLAIIQDLGEGKKDYPLYGHILTGEDKKTFLRNLTLENLRLALMRTHFFNSYDKDNNLIEHGFFDFGENDKTRPYILAIINLFFKKLLEEDELNKIWNEGDKGLLLTNNMVGALINLLDDYLVILNQSYKLNTSLKIADIISKLDRFIFALQHVLLSLSNEDKKFIKSSKGGSAPIDVKKRIGYLLSKELDEFTPEWLNDYIENYAQNNYHDAYQALDKLLVFLQNNIKESLEQIYNDKWELEGIDSDTSEELAVLKARAIRNNPNRKIEHLLEVSTFKELYKITTYKNHWSTVFKTKYQDDQKLLGEINPFVKLEKLYIKTEKKVSLSKTEFENLNLLIKKIYAENIKS